MITNTDDFYGLMPGAIGTLAYRVNSQPPSEKTIQNIQNDISSEMFSSYLANYQFTKGGSQEMDPVEAFTKARRDAREHAEDIGGIPINKSVAVQIGQQESKDLINKIEANPLFIGWMDTRLVSLVRSI